MKSIKISTGYFFGFTLWKRLWCDYSPFFDHTPVYVNTLISKVVLQKAIRNGLSPQCAIYIWGKRSFPRIEHYAHVHNIPLFRVEDGFIRSVGLGSDLTQPYSLVVDSRGIYFDPTQPSDLEYLLQNYQFLPEEIERAQKIKKYLIDKKLSKYNVYDNIDLSLPKDKSIIVIPGQVDDDASIRFGAPGMNNLELLKQVRTNRPDAYIVFKPHPDVLADNRSGHVNEKVALKYCDRIVSEVGIDSVLAYADEVHTMTSLVGFEAMMRGVKVVTYGMPFYAGWGISADMKKCERRTRHLSIDELVAAVYLLYPRYVDPTTLKRCEIENVLDYLDQERGIYRHSTVVRIRNWFSRKSQMIIRMIKGL